MYASKRRQRNFKRQHAAPEDNDSVLGGEPFYEEEEGVRTCLGSKIWELRVREPTKQSTSTNPSKRHRERLNGELETVAQLLPYDNTTISRLDKLSVLRLAVSFLQVKAHFQACHQSSAYISPFPMATHCYQFLPRPLSFPAIPTVLNPVTGQPLIDPKEPDFETIAMKALGGFILVLNENGDIYYASDNVEQFLGFHQSDILHQPLYDLIHSEDREDIRQQLDLAFCLPTGCTNPQELMASNNENLPYLDRNVNARFRCLLDNTCGFLRIDMRGKLMSLHGLPSSFVLGRSLNGPVMGLVAVCTPFVPPSNQEIPTEDLILKTKHHLDGTLVSMDEKVHAMLELTENDLPISFYQIVHVEDAICLAEAHKEVLKNGSSGLLIYRLMSTRSARVYYVQSSCRMFYKNGKPESIGLTHRLLNEVEGTMLLEKRSSLKAKLLSFDDSFLQSPRNLQSTAALPLPSVKEEFGDEESSSSFSCSFGSSAPASSTVSTSSRVRKKRDELPLQLLAPTALVPKIPIEQWHILQQPMGEFSHLPFPSGAFPPELNGWPQDGWTTDIYPAAYPAGLPVGYPPLVQPLPPYAGDLGGAGLDYWNGAHLQVAQQPLLMNDEIQHHHIVNKELEYNGTIDYGKPHLAEYPLLATTLEPLNGHMQASGFQLISEVTNTLLNTQ